MLWLQETDIVCLVYAMISRRTILIWRDEKNSSVLWCAKIEVLFVKLNKQDWLWATTSNMILSLAHIINLVYHTHRAETEFDFLTLYFDTLLVASRWLSVVVLVDGGRDGSRDACVYGHIVTLADVNSSRCKNPRTHFCATEHPSYRSIYEKVYTRNLWNRFP